MRDYLELQAILQPARLAFHDLSAGRRWNYGQAATAILQWAAALRARGIGPGDRVAALARNRAELVFLHFACARLGAIYVPLNWRLTPPEIQTLIDDAQPSLILGDNLLAAAGLNGVEIDQFADQAAALAPMLRQATDPAAPCLILYTSGTSGRPKGVLLSENNLWQTGRNFGLLARVTHESVFLCDAPMFHVIGLITNIRPAMLAGGACIISDGFVAGRTLERLGESTLGVSHYFCVPQMAAMLRADENFDPAKLRGLTAIFSGGAPHAADAIKAWTAQGILVSDGFGMSECGTLTCMPLDIDAIEARAGAAGLATPDVQIRILDEAGHDCPPGATGEVVVKGANVTAGYWRQPEATRAAFTADGWLRSGDIGRLDEAGYLWIVDRKKDMFISGGENVYPAEIEAALAAHPDITECAVIGVPDERWGEVGHLVLVAARPGNLEPETILSYLNIRLARYKIPKYVSVVGALPRNGAGKILKAKLREFVAARV